MAILLLVNEGGNLPVAGKNSDRNGAATVLCEEPDVARPKIFYEIRGDSFAGWKFRRGRNDSRRHRQRCGIGIEHGGLRHRWVHAAATL